MNSHGFALFLPTLTLNTLVCLQNVFITINHISGSHGVMIHSSSGNLIRSFVLLDTMVFSPVFSRQIGVLAITMSDGGSRAVESIDDYGDRSKTPIEISDEYPGQICNNDNQMTDRLYVDDSEQKIVYMTNLYLRVFSPEGKNLLHQIDIKNFLRGTPRAVTQNREGHFLVLCDDNITCIDRTGEQIWDCTQPHDFYEKKLLCDDCDRMLICQRSCIAFRDSKGNYIHDFPTENITAIQFRSIGRLITLSYNGKIIFWNYNTPK